MKHTGLPDRSELHLDPLRVPKAADVLAEVLRGRILSGALAEGAALPPERELVVQTGLSRATVRDALRVLQVENLLRIRPGRAGGAFVQRPDGDSVAHSVRLVIQGQQLRLETVHETREVIEPACAALAARRRTDNDLAALDAANADMLAAGGDVPSFLQANVSWHNAVAAASGNELLIGFMKALSQSIYTATDLHSFLHEGTRAVTLNIHRRITDAIRDQDADAAVRRMTRHVHGFAVAAEKVDQRQQIDLGDSIEV